jgi:hypothetical protein
MTWKNTYVIYTDDHCLYTVRFNRLQAHLEIQLSRGKDCNLINLFNPAPFLCLSQCRTWISNVICRGTFFVFSELRWEGIVRFVDMRLQSFPLDNWISKCACSRLNRYRILQYYCNSKFVDFNFDPFSRISDIWMQTVYRQWSSVYITYVFFQVIEQRHCTCVHWKQSKINFQYECKVIYFKFTT